MTWHGEPGPGDLFQCIRQGHIPPELDEQFPFYPLDAPGMPLPGNDFIQEAVAMGDQPPELAGSGKNKYLVNYGPNLHYLYRRALYDEQFTLNVRVKGRHKVAEFVPGHLIGDETRGMSGGPRPAKVMLIGKNPGHDEIKYKLNLVGPTSQIFFDALDELGVGEQERAAWYCANLVRWPELDDQSDTIPAEHKKDCAILLEQELRLIKPDYVLCLGSDASKWLLSDHNRAGTGSSYGVQSMVGRVHNITVPLHDRDEQARYHTIRCMALTHPASVHRTPELYDEFRNQLGLFLSLINGGDVGGRERGLRHVNVYKHRQLKAIVDEIRNDPDPLRRIIAIDGEWEGTHPGEDGAYLRTIQFSSKHGEGINVVLRHQGGSLAFTPSLDHARHELLRLFKTDAEAGWFPRIGGHFLRADLPWLIDFGLDVRDEYAPAPTPERCREEGGFETGHAYHAVHEAASYRLTDLTVRLTTAPVYDDILKQHINDYCKRHDIKKEDLEGFGFLPQWILHPEPTDPEWGHNYAQYDPDVTRRIIIRCLEPGGLLDHDWYGNSSWEPYWRSHMASLGVLSMELAGLTVDKGRVDELTSLYMFVKQALLEDFRHQINWPQFNPESAPQCVSLLFGDAYSQKRDKQTGARLSIRPEGAYCFNLTPIKSTGRRSRLWSDIVSRGETGQYNPSSDKEVLGILGHQHPLVMQLRDIKFITQILKGPLRPPDVADDGMYWEQDDDGNFTYSKGLASFALKDGKVHTHISQNKETGRGASSRPPLQNISKRREGDYSRILGSFKKNKDTGQLEPKGDYTRIFPQPLYSSPIRTIFRSSPGTVLIEADYTGAELAVIAWMANDPNMIDHVRRNSLPEDHPDHYDIHSQTAVRTFQLSCAPTKNGLKDSGFSPLRVAAKNVNFGIPYGRSAEAIARQCREEGVDVSEAECQLMIDFYFQQYSGTEAFLAECRRRSQNEQWLSGCYGRKRRFIKSRDRSVVGEQERQAQNFPIQNTVADAVWQAVANFHGYQQQPSALLFQMLLQIHDALLFEVPFTNVAAFAYGVNEQPSLLQQLMVTQVPIWPRFLDNTPMPVTAPYHFGIDFDVQINWGESITEEVAQREGIPQEVFKLVA